MRVFGIDPGSASPSWGVVGDDDEAHCGDIPMMADGDHQIVDVLGLSDIIHDYKIKFATIERVWAMPGKENDAPTCFVCHKKAERKGDRWICGCGACNRKVERGMGVSSAFNFGAAFGDLRSTLRLCGLKHNYVVPQVWKKAYGLKRADGETIGAFKKQSRLLAIGLFPRCADKLKRQKDEGRAEALLIAKWGFMELKGVFESAGLMRSRAAVAAQDAGELPPE